MRDSRGIPLRPSISLKELLKHRLKSPCYVENKSNLCARSILVNLFDPDVVYIGGRGFAEYGRLESTVLRVLRRRSPLGMGKELEILHDTDSLRAIEKGVTQVIYDKWNPLQK